MSCHNAMMVVTGRAHWIYIYSRGVGAVVKISASQSWGPQFDSQPGRGLNIWVTFFPAKIHAAFHPYRVCKMSTSIHRLIWSGCHLRLYNLLCFWSAGGKLIIVKNLWPCYIKKAIYKCTTLLKSYHYYVYIYWDKRSIQLSNLLNLDLRISKTKNSLHMYLVSSLTMAFKKFNFSINWSFHTVHTKWTLSNFTARHHVHTGNVQKDDKNEKTFKR